MFIQTFNFIVSTKSSDNYEHILIRSLIAGYILQFPFKWALSITNNNYTLDVALFIICCVIGAFIEAKIYQSKLLLWLFRKLNIKHTINSNIWYDILDYENDIIIYARLKDSNLQYSGVLQTVEDDQREPIIVISQYTLKDSNGNLLDTNSGKLNERTVINTANCSRIDLVYKEESYKIKPQDLHDILKLNKRNKK